MNVFAQSLNELEEYQNALRKIKSGNGIVQIAGCMDTQKAHMIYGTNDGFRNRIIVTFSEQKAKELQENYRLFDRETAYYPAKDILFYQSDIRGNQLTRERILVWKKLLRREPMTLVTTFDGLMNRMAELKYFADAVQTWKAGDSLNLEEARMQLVRMGYVSNYQVEMPGEFAVRGGILDVFPLTEENPYRIELWGDAIDSLRSFEAASQRSLENLEEVVIYPAAEFVLTDEIREKGLKKLQKEAAKVEKQFRGEMKNEEAHRVKTMCRHWRRSFGNWGAAPILTAACLTFMRRQPAS